MFENIKNKFVKFATNPTCVKAVNKVTNAVSAGCAAVTAVAISAANASAVDWGATITASDAVDNIASGASPFVEPAIIIMCSVAGLKLGMRFIRGSAH
ncbi:MAG: hypothetical protein ACI4J0_02425 [Huintestinicola sp.]|uniref:hypothetical protein n=1 Tax=Huintestinicola sp. TaxID=2981661 RepID=UPI003F02D38F